MKNNGLSSSLRTLPSIRWESNKDADVSRLIVATESGNVSLDVIKIYIESIKKDFYSNAQNGGFLVDDNFKQKFESEFKLNNLEIINRLQEFEIIKINNINFKIAEEIIKRINIPTVSRGEKPVLKYLDDKEIDTIISESKIKPYKDPHLNQDLIIDVSKLKNSLIRRVLDLFKRNYPDDNYDKDSFEQDNESFYTSDSISFMDRIEEKEARRLLKSVVYPYSSRVNNERYLR